MCIPYAALAGKIGGPWQRNLLAGRDQYLGLLCEWAGTAQLCVQIFLSAYLELHSCVVL
jgi:hypothetical protein